jgi:hypothetical protein
MKLSTAQVAILGPFLAVFGSALGVYWWNNGAPPGFRPAAVPLAIAEVTRDHRGVAIGGTAHLETRIEQTSGEEVWWLFPLFPKRDTSSRKIQVLVRTHTEPDAFYSFVEMKLEGMARPPGLLVPRSAREVFENGGYTLAEDFVLVEQFDPETPVW